MLFPEKHTINHIHGIWHYKLLLLYVIKLIFGAPYVVTIHGMLNPWALQQKRIKKKIFLRLVKLVLNRAATIIVNTDIEKNIVQDLLPEAPICVIENYINISKVNGRFDIDSNSIIYVGRFHPTKNLENLICAVAGLDINLKLYGYGSSKYTSKLSLLAKDYDNIEICEPIYGINKFDLLREAAGVILPSINEGFPMLILECWSVSELMIMNRNSNLNDAFGAGAALDCGESQSDLRRFFEYFEGLDVQKRVMIRQTGHQYVSRHYSKEVVLTKYRQKFCEIARNS